LQRNRMAFSGAISTVWEIGQIVIL